MAGGTGGYTFEGSGSGNRVDLSADPNSVTANLSTGSIGVASGSTDTVSGISSVVGSSAGGNTFVAGNGSESFADSGSVGGDTLDFSDVATSTSTPLTINVSGGQVNGESNDTATEGSTTYSFTSGGTDFTTFLGATTGHTSFLAGPTGGATFDGQGSSNTLNFMALVKALTVNVSGVMVGPVSNSTAATSGTTYAFSDISAFVGSSGGTTFYAGSAADTFAGSGTSGNTLNFAEAAAPTLTFCLVASGTCSAADQAVLGSVVEPFSGISTFVGSSAGDTTFVAGGTGGYTFEGSGSGNRVDLSADPNSVTANLSTGSIGVASGSTDTVSGISSVVGSSAGGNTFVAGNGSESFADSGSVGGDTLDFSDVATSTSTPLTINVSGGQVNGESNDTATEGSTTYSFTSGGTDFTTFLGATTGHTSFLAGPTGGATFDGQGSSNTLNLSAVHGGTTLSTNGDSTDSPGSVTGLDPGLDGSTADSFAGIQSIVGYPGDAITSVDNASAATGASFSFTVTTVGTPVPKLTKKGKLPKGVSFQRNGDGTATISGILSAKSSGSYRLTIKAIFGKGKSKVVRRQTFTLTVS